MIQRRITERQRMAQRLQAMQGMPFTPGSAAPSRFGPPMSQPGRPGATAAPRSWIPLRLDDKGRQIDEKGNVIKTAGAAGTATLKVNQNRARADAAMLSGSARVASADAASSSARRSDVNPYMDPRISTRDKRAEGRRKKLNFVKRGKYQRKAQVLRMEQISQQLRTRRTNASSSAEEAVVLLPVARRAERDPIPDVEWWDALVLGAAEGAPSDYDSFNPDIVPKAVTQLVHHPIPVPPAIEDATPAPRPLMLTKRERKKIRRMNKLEKERERQDLVSAGMLAPKEPRLKLSNMMKILMDEAVADPSAIEAKVRAQMAKRALAHYEHNASRKLSKQQKSDKLRKKLQEDTSVRVHVAVYSVPDLSWKKARFKVEINAQQYNMSGIGVISDACNVVVLEGGPRGAKKMKGLMMRRVKWYETDLAAGAAGSDSDEDSSDGENSDDGGAPRRQKCKLIWEGVATQRKFPTFRFQGCPTGAAARKLFADKGIEHYWDQCINEKINGQAA